MKIKLIQSSVVTRDDESNDDVSGGKSRMRMRTERKSGTFTLAKCNLGARNE